MSSKASKSIIFNTSLGKWELWSGGRPMATATRHETITQHFPEAGPVSETQLEIERKYREKQ